MSLEKPTPSGSEYLAIEEDIRNKRKELQTAPVDQMGGIVEEIQGREAERQGAYDAMYEDAHVENARIDAEHAERTAQIDAAIQAERAKLGDENTSVEGLSAVVQRIRELENQRLGGVPRVVETTPTAEPSASEKAPVNELVEKQEDPRTPIVEAENQQPSNPELEAKKDDLFRRYGEIPFGELNHLRGFIENAEFDHKTNTEGYRRWVARRDEIRSQAEEVEREYKEIMGGSEFNLMVDFNAWRDKKGKT